MEKRATVGLVQSARQTSPRGNLLVAACRSGVYLARKVAAHCGGLLPDGGADGELLYLDDLDDRFSDTETVVRLGADVSGNDVFLFQALYDPTTSRSIDDNYMAFFIAARAFREWGANHVTAVLPYLAYARQDKPAPFQREPTTAKLAADFAVEAGIDRLITWHPHLAQIHGFYGSTPVHVLDALGFWIQEFQRFGDRDDTVAVAPDAGASKFVTFFGRALELPCAIASKFRPRPEEAVVSEVIGDTTRMRVAIIVDDIISSGGTMEALIKKLHREDDIEEIHLGVSHNLCQPAAVERLQELHESFGLRQLIVTNTIPQTDDFRALPFVTIRDLSELLAKVIVRIHTNQPVSDLYYRATQ